MGGKRRGEWSCVIYKYNRHKMSCMGKWVGGFYTAL